jgi:hypothetical protein
MKSTLLTITMMTFLLFQGWSSLKAQNQIPNADFESWSGGVPTNWDTSNENILGTDFTCVTKEITDPESGISSSKVQTVSHNILFVGEVTMPGILTLGDVVIDIINQTGTVTGGVPVSGQPKYLRGYYKYQPASNDSCIIGIGLTRWNGTSTDTIAYSYSTFGGAVTAWQEFAVPIDYITWTQPDSMNIMIISSNIEAGTAVGGSTLWVDNLSLEYSGVAVNDIGLNKELFVNATEDGSSLIINTPGSFATKIEIYSLNGHVLKSLSGTKSDKSSVNITDLAHGMYIVRVTLANGTTSAIKFSHTN